MYTSSPQITADSCQAKRRKDQVETLLEKTLPNYLFTVDPALLKNTKGHPHPALLDQEVSRAIQNAEINLYLSYINGTNQKIAFLKEYQAIEDDDEGKTSTIAKEMKAFARSQPLVEKSQAAGEPVEVRFAKDKMYKDKEGKEHFKHKAGDVKSKAFKFQPLAKEQMEKTEAENADLKAQIDRHKEHTMAMGYRQ